MEYKTNNIFGNQKLLYCHLKDWPILVDVKVKTEKIAFYFLFRVFKEFHSRNGKATFMIAFNESLSKFRKINMITSGSFKILVNIYEKAQQILELPMF